jgi:hypothetical protein
MAGLVGSASTVGDPPNPPVRKKRPAVLRLVLILLAAASLIAGLAVGETAEILFKGSIL